MTYRDYYSSREIGNYYVIHNKLYNIYSKISMVEMLENPLFFSVS